MTKEEIRKSIDDTLISYYQSLQEKENKSQAENSWMASYRSWDSSDCSLMTLISLYQFYLILTSTDQVELEYQLDILKYTNILTMIKENKMTKEDIIQQSTIDREQNLLILPDIQLDRKTYQIVADHLERLGGKWNRSKKGFVFAKGLPEELFPKELPKSSKEIQKEFQFFPTPSDVCDRLVEMAELRTGDWVLEPSAGQGAIIDAVLKKNLYNMIDYCEIYEENKKILKEKYNRYDQIHQASDDFLTHNQTCKYHRIIANPPFTKNQDIKHIRKMYDHLTGDGIVVSVCSNHWRNSSRKLEKEFVDWLETKTYEIEELPVGTFKESGTNISSCILKIWK